VYCYYAEDTIEKSILDLAWRQGNSLYASNPAELDSDVVGERNEAKSLAREKGKAQKGDFVARCVSFF
jgi:E3 ubiquitin-protein ligase SHPRH